MKPIFITLTLVSLTFSAVNAQVNRDKNETTTIKKVTQKGTEVNTKVIKETDTENEILKVEGTNKQDQSAEVVRNRSTDTQLVADEISVDAANEAKRQAIKEKQEAQLAASIEAQYERAAAEAEQRRQEMAIKQRQELEARRAQLTKRPDGMAKLRKD